METGINDCATAINSLIDLEADGTGTITAKANVLGTPEAPNNDLHKYGNGRITVHYRALFPTEFSITGNTEVVFGTHNLSLSVIVIMPSIIVNVDGTSIYPCTLVLTPSGDVSIISNSSITNGRWIQCMYS